VSTAGSEDRNGINLIADTCGFMHISTKNKDSSTVLRLSPGMRISGPGSEPDGLPHLICKLPADRRHVSCYNMHALLGACEAADVTERNTRSTGTLHGRGPYTNFVWYHFKERDSLAFRIMCLEFDAVHAITPTSIRLAHMLDMERQSDGTTRPPVALSSTMHVHKALDNLAITFGLLFHLAFREALQSFAQFVRNNDVGNGCSLDFVEYAILSALYEFSRAARAHGPIPFGIPGTLVTGEPISPARPPTEPKTAADWASVLHDLLRDCTRLLTPIQQISINLPTLPTPLGLSAAPRLPRAPASPALARPSTRLDGGTPRRTPIPAAAAPTAIICTSDLLHVYGIPTREGRPHAACKYPSCKYAHYKNITTRPLAEVLSTIDSSLKGKLEEKSYKMLCKKVSTDAKFTSTDATA
jgi:hypothetical protein